jgi:predicted glycoside hydrolase/deacetylase ChbG (UPF0249 family)
MKYLIVSADDFGLSKSINSGIIKAFKDGIVRSIQVMPAAKEFQDALAQARNAGINEMGVHLSLVTRDGKFPQGYSKIARGLFFKKINLQEVELEFRNQLECVKCAGFKISSLSSHEHIHMLPDILRIFVKLAKEYNIPAIRYPHKDKLVGLISINKFFKICVLAFFQGKMKAVLKDSGLIYADNFLGLLDSGKLEEKTLIFLLKSLNQGSTELVTHPGFLTSEVIKESPFHCNCEKELNALTSNRVKKLVKDLDIQLVTFEEFNRLNK